MCAACDRLTAMNPTDAEREWFKRPTTDAEREWLIDLGFARSDADREMALRSARVEQIVQTREIRIEQCLLGGGHYWATDTPVGESHRCTRCPMVGALNVPAINECNDGRRS